MAVTHNKKSISHLARILWDYHNLAQPARPADFLLILGTNDPGIAKHAALIDKRHNYPAIVVSGGVFHQTSIHGKPFAGMESSVLSSLMIASGVNPKKILREPCASNTGENILLAKQLLAANNIQVKTGHLVPRPVAQRRALATAQRQWPEIQWSVSAQKTSFDAYLKGQDKEACIHDLVANTFKILTYPAKGFQTPQPMNEEVRESLEKLVKAGYTKQIDPAEWQAFQASEALHSPPVRATTNPSRKPTDLKR